MELVRGDDGERLARATEPIPAGARIATIPLRYLITARVADESAIGRRIARSRLALRSTHSRLAAYLLVEDRKPKGFWRPYLDSLPRAFDHLPIRFGPDAFALLGGSSLPSRLEAFRSTIVHDHALLRGAIPALRALTLDEMLWARQIVASRVFGFTHDGRRTFGLVPFADMFNHGDDPDATCGYSAREELFVVRTLRECRPGQEIRWSYGHRCNSRMLVGYGFCSEHNPENEAELVLPVPADETRFAALAGRTIGRRERDVRRFSVRASLDDADALFSFLRLACATPHELTLVTRTRERWIAPIGSRNERAALHALATAARAALARFETTIERDEELLAEPGRSRVERSCLLMRRGEKLVVQAYLDLANLALPFLRLTRDGFLSAVSRHLPHGTLAGAYLTDLATRAAHSRHQPLPW